MFELFSPEPFDLVILLLLVVAAVIALRVRDLLAASVVFGTYSFLICLLWAQMEAVDVAFTEAAVGAGISTILMLATLSLTTSKESRLYQRPQPLALIAVLLTGAALVYATFDMPRYGDPAAPIHHHVADDYIERIDDEIGVPNMVTAILASFRGYDTWGEATVIFTAGVGVMLLLGGGRTVYRIRRKNDGGSDDGGSAL